MVEETKTDNGLPKSPSKKIGADHSHGTERKLPSAFDLFTPSVNIIKNNLFAFLILLGIPALLSFIGGGHALYSTDGTFKGSGSLLGLAGLISLLAAPAVLIMQLKGTRKEPISFEEAFRKGLTYFWRIFGLAILSTLIFMVSLLLFIVPFFIVLPRIFLAQYYLIDRDLGIIEALKASNADYKQHGGVWGIIGVYLLMILANAIPIVGVIITNILTFLYSSSSAIRYEQIKKLKAGKVPKTPIETNPQLN